MIPNWPSWSSISRGTILRVALSWGALLLALGAYWTHLRFSHESQLEQAAEEMHLRASQTAHALALQISTLIDQVNYLASHLGDNWLRNDKAEFRRAIQFAQQALPAGAPLQVSIADKHGNIVFSSLSQVKPGTPPVSIADREHFRVHVESHPPRLYISQPVLGRVSQKWAVQFSLPFFDQGNFAGVTVISISPEHLSRALHDLFPGSEDVALLLREDGTYLARSHNLERILGRSVPTSRSFLSGPKGIQQGSYEVVSPIDGVLRYYAWRRTSNAPLVLSLGLSKEKALAPLRASQHTSTVQNAAGTGLLLLAAAWITLLYLKNRRQTDKLLNTTEQLELVLHGGNLGAWDWDLSANTSHYNQRWADKLGYPGHELPRTPSDWEKLVHPDDLEKVRHILHSHLNDGAPYFEAEYRIRHYDGHWRWFFDRGRIVKRGPDGQALRMAGTALDITARKHAEVAEAEYRERMATLLQRFPGGVLMENGDGVVVMVNRLFCQLFDMPDLPDTLCGLTHARLQTKLGNPRAGWLVPRRDSQSEQRKTIEVTTASGRTLEIDWVPIAHEQDYLGHVWLVWDISQRKQQEALLTAQAKTDALTGLRNRHSFMPYLEAMVGNHAASGRESGALLLLDLDHFKRINDSYGHPAGDAVLQHTARVIRESLRETDTAGRLGGEEFGILLPRTNLEDARMLANRLIDKLAASPARTDKGDISITVSIGIAMLAGASAKQAFCRADEALYAAKAGGRNQACVWNPQDAQRLLAEPMKDQ